MLKRHTSHFKNSEPKVLHLKVRSPRIYWCMACRFSGKLLRMAVVFGLLGGLLWAGAYGLRRSVLHNEEFQIRQINLNPNRILDEQRLLEIGEIDPNGSLFAVDLESFEKKLAALPAIAAAHAERELPDTLNVRVIERNPLAWIEMPEHAIPGRDVNKGLLIDERSVVFPCPPGMVEQAANLPVIVVAPPETRPPAPGEKFQTPELTHAIELLNLCRSAADSDEFPIDRIEQQNDWSMLVRMRNGVVARFGLIEQDRQVADLFAALRYSRKRKYNLATINLIPKRNIPVTFATPPPPPPPLPRAIPVAAVPLQSKQRTTVKATPAKAAPARPAPAPVKVKPARTLPVKNSPAANTPIIVKPAGPPPASAPAPESAPDGQPIPRAIIVERE